MKNFRLVVLDYPKLHIHNPITKNILIDIIVAKQKGFERTDEFYVPNDRHDLIGTHFLIYDVANPFQQKLIFGIRVTYEERARKHKTRLPILEVESNFNENVKQEFKEFRKKHTELVDCNSLFVDQDYSFKSKGIKFIDIGYSMIIFHLMRLGKEHMVGGTNEKYRSSKWLENFGQFQKDHYFKHPVVEDPHLLVMLENFNLEYVHSVYSENKELFDNLIEFVPESLSYKKMIDTYEEIQQQTKARQGLKLAI